MSAPLVIADLDNGILATHGRSIWDWYQGGYDNWATGIVLEQVVSDGPWPVTQVLAIRSKFLFLLTHLSQYSILYSDRAFGREKI